MRRADGDGRRRLPISIGDTVRYWSDVLVADEDGPFIPFFDHRREHGIVNWSMRQNVFSMQHLWVRERQPDIMDARLAVIQFPSEKDSRSIRIEFLTESDLLSYEELDSRIRTVYETWAHVSADKGSRSPSNGHRRTKSIRFSSQSANVSIYSADSRFKIVWNGRSRRA